MILIRLLLTLAIPLLLGYSLVAPITKKTSLLERFGLAWGIGIGLLGLEMFIVALLGLPVNLLSASIPTLIVILVLVIILISKRIPLFNSGEISRLINALFEIKKGKPPHLDRRAFPTRCGGKEQWLSIAEKALILLIALTIIYVFFDALVKPIVNFDDLWRQGCIAKIVFTTGKVFTDQTLQLAGPHPFLNPLSQAWIYLGIGAWNDALGKIVFALCFASLIFVFYAGLRRYQGRFYALLFTYLLTSFPLIVYHAGTAYSDLMQTFYYTAGIIYLFHWFKARNNPDLYISALFLGIGVFVKQLGTPLWIIAMIVLAAYLFFENKKQFSPALPFILISGLVSLPWLVNRQSFILTYTLFFWAKIFPATSGPSAAAAINAPYGPPNLGEIIRQMGRRMFLYADWQVLWFALPLSLIFSWQKFWGSQLKYLGLLLLLGLLTMVYGFTEQNAYTFLIDGTLVQRMLMYQVPVALFLAAMVIQAIISPSGISKFKGK